MILVASAIFYGVVCWSSSISAAGSRRLDKLTEKLSSLLVQQSHPLQVTNTAVYNSFSDRLINRV